MTNKWLFPLFLMLGLTLVFCAVLEADDPYIPITTYEELNKIGNDPSYPLSGHYKLTTALNVKSSCSNSSEPLFRPIGTTAQPFTGRFDGQGNSILGLTIRSPKDTAGLFGVVAQAAVLENIVLERCTVEGNSYIGGLTGENYGILRNCSVSGTVRGAHHIGLLCGMNRGGIENCKVEGNVIGNEYVGGITGSNQDNARIERSAAQVHVSGTEVVGGIAGANLHGRILECQSGGTVQVKEYGGGVAGIHFGITVHCSASFKVEGEQYIGGAMGANYGIILFTKTTGIIDGMDVVGGFVGYAGNGIINQCSAETSITGRDKVGGFAGMADDAFAMRGCLAKGHVKGRNQVGGLVGNSSINSSSLFSAYWEDGDFTTEGVTLDNLITECYSETEVLGEEFVGGLVGSNLGNMITNSYAVGNVTGNAYVGGLIGINNLSVVVIPPVVRHCFAWGEVIGENHKGGLVGAGPNDLILNCFYKSAAVTEDSLPSLGTAIQKKSFADKNIFLHQEWNFERIWQLNENDLYPKLRLFDHRSNISWESYVENMLFMRTHPSGLESSKINRKDFSDLVKNSIDNEQEEELARIQALGYFISLDDGHDKSGVVIHQKGSAYHGLNLYISEHAPQALLMDMDGNILHKWERSAREIEGLNVEDSGQEDFWTAVRLLDGGEILVIRLCNELIKLDRYSNVIWFRPIAAHHSFDIASNGDIYVLTQNQRSIPRVAQNQIIQEDFVVILDADGNEKERISLLECFENSPGYRHIWEMSLRKKGDIFHTNSLRILTEHNTPSLPLLHPGQVLTSFRELNTIAVVDLQHKQVVWAQRGPWRGQHDPHFLDKESLLVFDNYGRIGKSTIYEFDIASMKEIWRYQGSQSHPFYTETKGMAYRLPNGNTLIVESEKGRAIEVTPDKRIVWEFITGHKTGSAKETTALLFDLIRLPIETCMEWLKI